MSLSLSLPAGHLCHSHSYRSPEPFAGLAVVLVGAGPSGVDLALELAPLAAQVVLSHRGAPVVGLPETVRQASPISEVLGQTVRFGDGSSLQADALVLCTGYRYSFPFLALEPLGLRALDRAVVPLYRHLLPPRHPSLLFIGLCQQICPFPHFHWQVLYALAVLGGDCRLPPAPDMEAEAEEELERYLGEGGAPRHFLRLAARQWDYAAALARLAGFAPPQPAIQEIYDATRTSRLQHLLSYRSLNYRLLGPDAWELVVDGGHDAGLGRGEGVSLPP
uniref:Flavin-containing monooxygenase n=1 Tax=Sphenodon punctatus TaxID=8508 RepID=A0A8D0H663_SPHPU